MWLVKIDSDGNPAWNQTYGGVRGEGIHSMIDTSAGYVLAGWTRSYGTANSADVWIVKTDGNGTLEWNQTYGGTGWDWPWSIIQTLDGGYAFVSDQDSFGAGNRDWWLVKTNTSGYPEWNKTFGGINWDWPKTLVQTVNGEFVIAGSTESYGTGSQDIWLIKLDLSGELIWSQTYGGTQYERCLSMIQTTDGGFVLGGLTFSYGTGYEDVGIYTNDADMWLVKTDSDGEVEWNQTYGETGADELISIIQTTDGGFIFTGNTESSGAGDICLIKTDVLGQVEWNNKFGGIKNDWVESMIQAAANEFVLVGGTESYGAGAEDMWVLKVIETETTAPSPGFELFITSIVLVFVFVLRKNREMWES